MSTEPTSAPIRRRPWRFSPTQFLSDPAFQGADLALRGAWIQIQCVLWLENRTQATYELEDWARLLRASPEETLRLLKLMQERNLAEIVEKEGLIILRIAIAPSRTRRKRPQADPAAKEAQCAQCPLAAAAKANQKNSAATAQNSEKVPETPIGGIVGGPPPDQLHVEFVDVEKLVKRFHERAGEHWTAYRVALDFAAHLTRRNWRDLSQAVERVRQGQGPWLLQFNAAAA